jgi:hypothetical protein
MRRKYIVYLLLASVVFQACKPACHKCIFRPGERVTFVYRSSNPGFPVREDIVLTADSKGCIDYDPDDNGSCEPGNGLEIIRNGGAPTPTFFAQGAPFDLTSPPSSITLSGGSGLYSWYGMPMVEFFDDHGQLMDLKIASAMGDDGSWCTVDLPNMAGRYSGTYYVRIACRDWDGTYDEMGAASMDFYGRDRVDNDGDGWTDDVDCNDNDPNVNPGADPDCTGVYFDRNCNGVYDYDECNPSSCGSIGNISQYCY